MAKGASKAVDKFFSEAFDQFTEVFRSGWASVFNQDDADAYLRYLRSFNPDVGRYLAGKFVELSLVRPMQMIVQSFVEATAGREGDPAGYQERVYGLLMDKLRDELPGNPREAGEAMLSAFKDVAGGRSTAEAS